MSVQCSLQRASAVQGGGGEAHAPVEDVLRYLFPGASREELQRRVSRLLAHAVPGPAELTVGLLLRYTAAFTVRAAVDLLAPEQTGSTADGAVDRAQVSAAQVDAVVTLLVDAVARLFDAAEPAPFAPWDTCLDHEDASQVAAVFAAAAHSVQLAAGELLRDTCTDEPLLVSSRGT